MKFTNQFLVYLSKKYEFNAFNEWDNFKKEFKGKVKVNEIELLIHELSNISGFTYEQITGNSRKRELVDVKHIGRYIAYQNLLGSLEEIGQAFGQKDHTTIIHSIEFVDSMVEVNQIEFISFFKKYEHLLQPKLSKDA